MRPVLTCALCLAVMAPIAAAVSLPRPGVTIVLEFQGPRSERAVGEMKRELEAVLKDSGLQFDWRLREDVDQSLFPNLVLVRFKGKCVLEPVGYLYDERGPLAFTHTTDGAVQPFSEVACDKVSASVRSALWGGDYASADLLFGRALGRVLAHELVHIVSRSSAHGKDGVTRSALSGSQLIGSELPLSPSEIERLRRDVTGQ